MKNLILLSGFLILCGCEELPFTNEDITVSTEKPKNKIEEIKELDNIQADSKPPLPEKKEEAPVIQEETEEEEAPVIQEETEEETEEENEEPPFLEEEITLISEDLELMEATVIKNRKVVLDMVAVKTFEHDLFIIAKEFLSNHSVIHNFPENKKAGKNHHGKNGGNILIEAEKAIGELQLVLNGEQGGNVPRRASISKSEKERLRGTNGKDGQDAVYRKVCHSITLPFRLSPIGNIPPFSGHSVKKCWYECASSPTAGEDGGRGRRGIPGHNGKNGGDSGSFHLKAFEFSDFHLVNIKKIPGLGSPGGKGSLGGYGGDRGQNGRDRKKLCDRKLSRPKKGDKGRRGHRGKDGRDGKKGEVCLEKLIPEEEQGIKTINTQTEVEIVCEEIGEGRSCQKALVQKKENTICY